MKKVISIMLIMSFLFSFAACSSDSTQKPSGETTKPTDTKPGSDTVYYESDELPDLDFGGEEVVILTPYNKEGGLSFTETEFTVEDLNSNALNDSIYNRELYVEDRLGVEITNVKREDAGGEIEKMFSAGEDAYDAYINDNAGLSMYVFEIISSTFTPLITLTPINRGGHRSLTTKRKYSVVFISLPDRFVCPF